MKMKIIFNKFLLYSTLLIVLLAAGCTDLRGTYEEYLGDGEIVYTGKIDSTIFRQGFGRVQMEGYTYFAKTAKKIVIEWDDKQKVVNIADVLSDGRCKILIDDLEERNYVFKVHTLDASDNRSIVETFQVQVPNERFIAEQRPRQIESVKANEKNMVEILLANMAVGYAQVQLEYKDSKGANVVVMVPPSESKVEINDFQYGGTLKITPIAKPSEIAIDSVIFTSSDYPLPTDKFIDRSKFVAMEMASDAPQLGGSAVNMMWDGNNNSVMHSNHGVGVPNHVTIDLGAEYNLVKGRIIMRDIFIWCPFEYQIWGLSADKDPLLCEPDVPDNFDNKDLWVTQSKAKGWVNLTDNGTQDYATRVAHNLSADFNLDRDKKVRYIRYRPIRVYQNEGDNLAHEGYGVYASTGELYFFADPD